MAAAVAVAVPLGISVLAPDGTVGQAVLGVAVAADGSLTCGMGNGSNGALNPADAEVRLLPTDLPPGWSLTSIFARKETTTGWCSLPSLSYERDAVAGRIDFTTEDTIVGDPIGDDAPVDTGDSFYGSTCVDSVQPSGYGAWRRAVENSSGYFGPLWAFNDNLCYAWPGKDRDAYRGPFTAETSNPILVATTTYDPATPYQGSLRTASLLPDAALLTVDGWGHATFGRSLCASETVDGYFLDGPVTRETQCDQDIDPFAAPEDTPGTPPTEAAAEAEAGAVTDAVTADVVQGTPENAVAAAMEARVEAALARGDLGTADQVRLRQALLGEVDPLVIPGAGR